MTGRNERSLLAYGKLRDAALRTARLASTGARVDSTALRTERNSGECIR